MKEKNLVELLLDNHIGEEEKDLIIFYPSAFSSHFSEMAPDFVLHNIPPNNFISLVLHFSAFIGSALRHSRK
jgi:hypothetical protein